MYLIPAPGSRVLFDGTSIPLPAAGAEVPNTPYYQRVLAGGDAVLGTAPDGTPTPTPTPPPAPTPTPAGTVPTRITQLTNDAGFVTGAQVDVRVAQIVGAAPAALDTLAEIATHLISDESAAGALTAAMATKQTAAQVQAAITTALRAATPPLLIPTPGP